MHQEPAHHGPNYFLIYFALLGLTALTVGVAYVHIAYPWNIVVAMAIAATKITMVGLFFMHLKFEVKPIYIVIGVPLLLSIILVMALIPDVVKSGP